MELTLQTVLIVCPLIFLAGFVDAIGGGGGLISLPAYIFAGVPVHGAIATNKMSSTMGTVISTLRYCRHQKLDWVTVLPSIGLALAGSSVGAHISMLVDEEVLRIMLIIVLPVVAFYVLRKKDLDDKSQVRLPRRKMLLIAWGAAFMIGCYDGFYGPGTGTFLILVFTGLAHMDMMTAAVNTKMVNLSSNVAALVIFLLNGKVYIALGVLSGVFCIAGHYMGSGMVLKSGTKVVRPIIVMVLGVLFIKTVFRT